MDTDWPMTADAAPRLPRATLFAVASPTASQFLTRHDLEASLFYNLLLQPEGIAVPDVYFFNKSLIEHFKKSPVGNSWFEQAYQVGLVTPWVRSADLHNFGMLKANFAVEKLVGHHTATFANRVAARLDRLTRTPFSQDFKPKAWEVWPARMGNAFAEVVLSHLDRPPGKRDGPRTGH